MLPFCLGFVAGGTTATVIIHFALIRKLQLRVAYLETQFKERFAQII